MASQHTAEFRQEAVRVALTSGLDRKQVAADFESTPKRGAVVGFDKKLGIFSRK